MDRFSRKDVGYIQKSLLNGTYIFGSAACFGSIITMLGKESNFPIITIFKIIYSSINASRVLYYIKHATLQCRM